ncbi:MAG: sigma-70 family RNA polymerase sigma factor [Deltaproteobacteria bacterium]|nr:sigma-70 family RNA polymerase sigma factor [Deltaproteobacteria bacterium]
MESADPDPRLAELTAEMAWLRRLARTLLRGDEAEDLAQDAFVVAAADRPDDGRPLRPWLSRVARNLARMRVRGRTRREAREHANAAAAALTSSPTPDELVQRVELQQLVASEVLRLAEPYRSTVLLHYFEELTCAEIARRLELPEGTVRRRLKVALDELRARIAERERGSGGLAVLAPIAGYAEPSKAAGSLAMGAIAMKKVVVAALVLLVLVVAFWLMRRNHGSGSTTAPASALVSGSNAPAAAGGGPLPSPQAEGTEVPAWLRQPDVKRRRIAGRVTFRGAPVAGATVELASLASESGLVTAPRRTTTSTGEFDFGVQAAMPWSVRATAPDKTGAIVDVDLREPHRAPPPDRLELQLGTCAAAMFGTVRDASGGPIVKARIVRLPEGISSVPGGLAVTSNDKGTYELCVEPRWPGFVTVDVSADGYAAIAATTIVPGRIEVDFSLVPEATIVGRVIRDDTGAPIPYAYVFVPPGPRGASGTPLRAAFTDATGHFRLDRMTAGRHLLFARAEAMSDSPRGTPAVVGVGQTSVEVEIRLAVGSTIRGTVVDHQRRPIGGARVAAVDTQGRGPLSTAVSQDDGSFVLTGVPRAEIRFTALPYDVAKPAALLVSLATHEGVILEVEPLGTVIGRVIRGGKPLPGAFIGAHGPNDQDLPRIIADANGRFEARGLRPGAWSFSAEDTRIGAFGSPPGSLQLGRGETKEITIDVAYAASIAGRVVDQNGAPVSGVTVLFRHTSANDAGQATTDIDGNYRAATMTGGGSYRPAVMRNVLASSRLRPTRGTEFPLIALADGNASVTGVMLAVQIDHLEIAGTVVDGDGAPVPDVRVVAELVPDDGEPRLPWGAPDPADTTDVDGRFSIRDLDTGTYALRARSATGVDVTLAGIRAGRRDVTLVLPAPGAIDVTVVGFKTAPEVSAVRSTTWSAPVAATLQGNVYVLRNLSPGSYIVTARTAGEAASAVVEVAAARTTRSTLTSTGSGAVAGHVREFRTGKPIEGMTCRAVPRLAADTTVIAQGDGVRTDAQGAFMIPAAPAGQIAVSCDGLSSNYSDGLRLVTLQAAQRIDVDVPVVGATEVSGVTLASIGADRDPRALVVRLIRIKPGGPAALAGLIEGDVVVTVDGVSVTELSPGGAWLLIWNRAPGTKTKLGVTRGGKLVNAELTAAEATL